MSTGDVTHNIAKGRIEKIVQAGTVHGGVHLHGGGSLPTPHQLPHDITAFSGREQELRALDALVGRRSTVCLVTGPPGVGKTALVVRWAHRVKADFPDGQLYVNLGGFDRYNAPANPSSVLDDFLTALDIPPDRIPSVLDGKAGLFRSLLVDRTMLLLLDNARSPEQVRPLLPAAPPSLVVVTGRGVMPGMVAEDGAESIEVRPLSRSNGALMLTMVVSTRRDSHTDSELARLSELCGGLPLALRIVSQRLVVSPYLPLSEIVDDLAAENSRLGELVSEDDSSAVRTAFSWSYEALAAEPARMFRLLGLHGGPHFDAATAAAVADRPIAGTRRSLASLVAAHLVEHGARNRYQFHDLLRLYALERVTTECTAAEREAAVQRLVQRYRAVAGGACEVIRSVRPPFKAEPRSREFEDYDSALTWLDDERENLLAAVRQASILGSPELAWRLAGTLWAYFDLRKAFGAWGEMLETGLACARLCRDELGIGLMLLDLGTVRRDQGDFEAGAALLAEALAAFEHLGDAWGVGSSLMKLGDVHRDLASYETSLRFSERALEVWRSGADLGGEAWTLRNQGLVYRDLGRDREALDAFRRCRELFEELGDVRGAGSALRNEGVVQRALGELMSSRQSLERALAVQRAAGDAWNEACTLERLGETLRDLGEDPHEVWVSALLIFEGLQDRRVPRVRALLDRLGK
ncbi:ATP-binding protein [Lentzea sp. NPDC055074]